MPNTQWDKLNHLQLGRYAEYFAKMEFALFGLDVYTSEVDDHGIDFIVKDKHGRFCEIQVKSLRKSGYTFMRKSKFDINNRNLYLILLIFEDEKLPDIFLIPSNTWQKPDGVFVDRNYNKAGQISEPEFGVNVSTKNYELLKKYSFKNMIEEFI